VLRKLREVQDYEDHFRDEAHVSTALAAYYGMVFFLDDNVGRILRALDASGLREDTLVVYTSDHGDNLGTRTFWGKSNMYEEAVGVPMIMHGPGLPVRRRVKTPVSLVDGYPTILDAVGVEPARRSAGCRGPRYWHSRETPKRSERSSASITPSLRSPASSWSASTAGNTSTTRTTGRSCTTSKPTPEKRGISRARRSTRR
jgi:arylsulfatase A-like enzyme